MRTQEDAAVLQVREGVEAVPRARTFAREVLAAWAADDLLDDVVLVVSELVTNGLLHGGLPIELHLQGDGELVRVEVVDPSPVAPVRPRPGADAMTGRGIALVDAVSRRWGVDRLPHGKTVWAEIGAGPAEQRAVDVDALLASWGEDLEPDDAVTVELGDVPTDLLLAAKAHVDNLVREFTLAASGEASGTTGAVPGDLARLISTVVHRFAEARQAIKRQALTAAGRNQDRARLSLTLAPAAVEAGHDYLDALDRADAYARGARLLTLETPPQHRVFRQWYVEALVEQVRPLAPGEQRAKPLSFEQRLLEELGTLAAAQRATARAARLQAVTAALSGATTADAVADVVVGEGRSVLGAATGRLLVGAGPDELRDAERSSAAPLPDDPAAAAVRDGEPVWLETAEDRDSRFPGLSAHDPGTVSLCVVPVRAAGRTLGALRFGFDGPRLFDVDERSFLLGLAEQAAQALQRSALYEAERRARAEAEEVTQRLLRLQQVMSALAGAPDEEAVLDVFVSHAARALDASGTTFMVLVDDQTLRIARASGMSADVLQRYAAFPLSARLPATEALRTGRPVAVRHDAALQERFPELAATWTDDRSLVCVPVGLPGQPLGVISLSFASEHRFDDTQLQFLAALADTCAQALDRARALERAAAAVDRLAFLAAVPDELGGSRSGHEALSRLTRTVVPRLADWCAVHVVEDGEVRPLAVAHADPDKVALAGQLQLRHPPRADAAAGVPAVLRTGVSELHATVTDEQLVAAAVDPEHLRVLRELGVSSAVVVPLTGRSGTFGTLTLACAQPGRRYGPEDLVFAEDLARRAAYAVESADATGRRRRASDA